jgi:hypothetical protein
MSAFGIHHDLGKLGRGRRWADLAGMRSGCHDLVLIPLVQAAQCHLCQGDKRPSGQSPCDPPVSGIGDHSHPTSMRRVPESDPEFVAPFANSPTADIGGTAGVGALVEGGEIGIRGIYDDIFQWDAQHLGRHLPRMVSEPVPRSVAPISRLNEPSSFIFSVAAAISSPAMPLPCMTTAIPMPRRKRPSCLRYFWRLV